MQLSDPRTPVNLRQEGDQIVVDFAGTTLPTNLMRRYDVDGFRDAGQPFDAVRVDGSSRIVISGPGDFEQLAYQSDDQYVVEVQPATKVAAAADDKKEYKGERLTLNFQDIETRAVLQLLAETSGQNIVVSDTVQGNVTLRLQNVPWDQALDIVLRTKGLDKRQEGNVIIVAPADELAAREKAELESQKADPGARAAAHRVPAGQLREGVRPRRADQVDRRKTSLLSDARQRRRSTSAPTRCCCRTRPSGSRTSAAWSRRSTSRSSRC